MHPLSVPRFQNQARGHRREMGARRTPHRWLLAGLALSFPFVAWSPVSAQETVDACYVPDVGALYLVGLEGLPADCLDAAHQPITFGTGGSSIASVVGGTGIVANTVGTEVTLEADFAGPGTAGTVARSDHDHSLADPGNTAVGSSALSAITTGILNTAVGADALAANVDGTGNTSVGNTALSANTSGRFNTAAGHFTLAASTTGEHNSAFGYGALANLSTGSYNTALGNGAGSVLTSGDNNIYIGSNGVSSESNTIRIGNASAPPAATYIQGIALRPVSGGQVFVNNQGQLGTTTSSIRYKEDVEDLGAVSRRLFDLRPVSFRYRPEYDDGSGMLQYGLVAEEVEEVFPELVLRGRDGRPESVRYNLLSVLLLNELQRQEGELRQQQRELREREREVERQASELSELRRVVAEQGAAIRELRSVVDGSPTPRRNSAGF